MLSSFRLNGYSLGLHPRTLTSESPVMVIQIHGYPHRTFLLPLFFFSLLYRRCNGFKSKQTESWRWPQCRRDIKWRWGWTNTRGTWAERFVGTRWRKRVLGRGWRRRRFGRGWNEGNFCFVFTRLEIMAQQQSSFVLTKYNSKKIESKVRVLAAWNNHRGWWTQAARW